MKVLIVGRRDDDDANCFMFCWLMVSPTSGVIGSVRLSAHFQFLPGYQFCILIIGIPYTVVFSVQ